MESEQGSKRSLISIWAKTSANILGFSLAKVPGEYVCMPTSSVCKLGHGLISKYFIGK